jgi:hypothetical protein
MFIFDHYSLSIKAAAPIPVPIHIETTPYLPFVLFNSGNNVAICLAPVQPKFKVYEFLLT